MSDENKPEILEKYNCVNFDRCKNQIIYTEKDHAYYIQKGWLNADGTVTKPKYCKPCRIQRKAQKAQYGN